MLDIPTLNISGSALFHSVFTDVHNIYRRCAAHGSLYCTKKGRTMSKSTCRRCALYDIRYARRIGKYLACSTNCSTCMSMSVSSAVRSFKWSMIGVCCRKATTSKMLYAHERTASVWPHGLFHDRAFRSVRFHANGRPCATLSSGASSGHKTEKFDHRTAKALVYKLNEAVVSFHLERIFIFLAPTNRACPGWLIKSLRPISWETTTQERSTIRVESHLYFNLMSRHLRACDMQLLKMTSAWHFPRISSNPIKR